jgi:sialate O-acetylesterase
MRVGIVSALLVAAFPASAADAPLLARIFADHVVLQRDRPIEVFGAANPGESVTVTMSGATRRITAGADGRWRVALPALPAGGPHTLIARTTDREQRAADVLIGDVWLCSGQSNMEYPLRRALNGEDEAASANDPQLRIVKIAQKATLDVDGSLAKTPQWRAVTPDSAKDFSAACYFMVRDLRAARKVPIGAIDATWGGTPIRAWMAEPAVRATGGAEHAGMVDLYRRDPFAATRAFGESWGAWWRSQTGDRAGQGVVTRAAGPGLSIRRASVGSHMRRTGGSPGKQKAGELPGLHMVRNRSP